MSIKVKFKDDLVVVEEKVGPKGQEKMNFYYYDIVQAKQSRLGLKDEAPSRSMSAAALDFAKRFYVPKAVAWALKKGKEVPSFLTN